MEITSQQLADRLAAVVFDPADLHLNSSGVPRIFIGKTSTTVGVELRQLLRAGQPKSVKQMISVFRAEPNIAQLETMSAVPQPIIDILTSITYHAYCLLYQEDDSLPPDHEVLDREQYPTFSAAEDIVFREAMRSESNP